MSHDKSLKDLGGATDGQGDDKSLKVASGNSSSEISLKKHFNVSKVEPPQLVAPMPGVTYVHMYNESIYDNIYYDGNDASLFIYGIRHAKGREVHVKLYNHLGSLLSYKSTRDGGNVGFTNLDGDYGPQAVELDNPPTSDDGYSRPKWWRLELVDAISGASQAIRLFTRYPGKWTRTHDYSWGSKSNPYLEKVSSSDAASKGVGVQYGGSVTLALEFTGEKSRFDNIKSYSNNYTWTRNTTSHHNFSANGKTVTIDNQFKSPDQKYKLSVYGKFKDNNFNADATNYDKKLKIVCRLAGPGTPGYWIKTEPETPQTTSLPYHDNDNGTIQVRIVRSWHQSTNYTINLYKGSSLQESKSITNSEADYTFSGLDANQGQTYKVRIRDEDVKDDLGVVCERWASVYLVYGSTKKFYSSPPWGLGLDDGLTT